MSLLKATDNQILDTLETIDHSVTEDTLTYIFTIGETFYIQVKGGSQELPRQGNGLRDCPVIKIALYYLKPYPIPTELTVYGETESFEVETPETTYKFDFEWKYFPHIGIDPKNDAQFKSQPWADKFFRGNGFGYEAEVDRVTLCNILRYCDQMARLKVFW
jgi:hypothetical protein